MCLLLSLFVFPAHRTRAQFLIDKTGIYRPNTSSEGYEPYRYTKYVDSQGNSTLQNGSEVNYFKFSGSSLYIKAGGYVNEYRYVKTENNCDVYYFYCADCTQKWDYSQYLLVSQDKNTINSGIVGAYVMVYKKGLKKHGMIE